MLYETFFPNYQNRFWDHKTSLTPKGYQSACTNIGDWAYNSIDFDNVSTIILLDSVTVLMVPYGQVLFILLIFISGQNWASELLRHYLSLL